MSRAVLAVMAGLLCALAGVKYAASLRGEAVRLARWEPLLAHLALLLEEGTLAIPQALAEAAQGHHPPDALLREMSAAMLREPLLTPEGALLRLCGDWAEKPLLQRMCARLGRGSRENRCQAVRQAAQELALLARQAADRAEKDVKLWQTLGLIGGTCMTILLL